MVQNSRFANNVKPVVLIISFFFLYTKSHKKMKTDSRYFLTSQFSAPSPLVPTEDVDLVVSFKKKKSAVSVRKDLWITAGNYKD